MIKEIRKFDINRNLIIVACGCSKQGVQNGGEAYEYLQAGADAFTIFS